MNNIEKKEEFHQRLKILVGSEEPFRWAKRMGIPSATFSRIWTNHDIPKHEHLCRIAERNNVSLDWLLRGTDDSSAANTDFALVPLLGLANCGVAQGWYNESDMTSKILLPSFMMEEGAFAVLCHGLSMVPAGIPEGAVCLVYPNRPVESGKPALIRTKTFIKGKEIPLATVKIFAEEDEESITLKGWLDPDETGYQSPFIERRLRNCITGVAPVGKILNIILPESELDNKPAFDEELLAECAEALQPVFSNLDSKKFSETLLLLYKQSLKSGRLDLSAISQLMRSILG